MTKFFTEEILPIETSTYRFTGEDARYLTDVLRIRPGESLTLCDGAQTDFLLSVDGIESRTVITSVVSSTPNSTEPPYQVTLYQALVKGDKMDLIIQKAVELGVTRIIPFSCDRSVVRIDEHDAMKKVTRWQKIALEAARQSGRGIVPQISTPLRLQDALSDAIGTADLAFLPWEGERDVLLSTLLDDFVPQYFHSAKQDDTSRSKPNSSFFIGPEGGFSPEEIEDAKRKGIATVSLGRRILRTETAGLFVLSSLVYRLETF
jgi:16S rRNA (uracil1498-N3)-methyltransferase